MAKQSHAGKGAVTEGNSNFYACGSVYWSWQDNPIDAINSVGRRIPDDYHTYSDEGKVGVRLFATNAEYVKEGIAEDNPQMDHINPEGAKSIMLGVFYLEWQPPVPFVDDDACPEERFGEYEGYWKLSEEDEKKILKILFLVSADTLVNHFEEREVWHKGMMASGCGIPEHYAKSGAITQNMVIAEQGDSAK